MPHVKLLPKAPTAFLALAAQMPIADLHNSASEKNCCNCAFFSAAKKIASAAKNIAKRIMLNAFSSATGPWAAHEFRRRQPKRARFRNRATARCPGARAECPEGS
jgi:hypothetical protein